MKKSTTILLICIITLLILAIIGANIYFYVNKYAAAELTDNSIINFNQLYNYANTRSSYSGLTFIVGGSSIKVQGRNNNTYSNHTLPISDTVINLQTGHQYYFRYTISGSQLPSHYGIVTQANDYSTYLYDFANRENNDLIFYGTPEVTSIKFTFGVNPQTSYNAELSVILIDTTLCFGEEAEELNIEYYRYYFTSNYYSYTTGTPMPYSKSYLEGYMQGIEDTTNAFTYTLYNNVIGNDSFAFNYNGVTSNFGYDATMDTYLLYGYGGIPLGVSVENPTQITAHLSVYSPNYSGGKDICFYIYQNGSLVLLTRAAIIDGSQTNSTEYAYCDAVFNIPTGTNTIYIACFEGDELGGSLWCYYMSVEFKVTNISYLVQNAFNNGYNNGINEYAEGTDKYNNIYYSGYRRGQANTGAAWGDSWEFIGSAFNGIGEIFAIELLPNVPLSTFILVPLMISLVFFVVKLVKGGS